MLQRDVLSIDNSFKPDKPYLLYSERGRYDDASMLPWSISHVHLTRCTRHSETRHGYVVRLPHERIRRHNEARKSPKISRNQVRRVVQKTWKFSVVDDLIGYDSSITEFSATLLATNPRHALSHKSQTCVRPYLSLVVAQAASIAM
jgi:hypothetical protein